MRESAIREMFTGPTELDLRLHNYNYS